MSVDAQQLNDELSGVLSDCQVSVEGGGGKFLVTVIGDVSNVSNWFINT